MKRILAIVISASFCLSLQACNSLLPAQKATITPLQSYEKIINSNPLGWGIDLSPSGSWLVQYSSNTEGVIRIISTSNPEISIQDNNEEQFGQDKSVQAWSPDSLKFAVVSSDNPGKCSYNKVVIYKIINSQEFSRNIFNLPENRYDCPGIYWSWNDLYLAVTDSMGHIYILDSNANLINTIDPSQDGKWVQMIWTMKGIFASISHFDNAKNSSQTELWLINPDKPEENKLLFTKDISFSVDGIDPTGGRLLLSVGAETVNDPKQLRLWVFDVKTNQVIKEVALPGDVWYGPELESVTSASWVAYIIGTPETAAQRKLYLFDWSKIELIDYGEATGLVGWRSNVNGFIIIKGKTGDYSIDVVTPK